MKKLYAIIGLAGALLVPNLYASFDGTIILNWNPEYPNNGGPFEAATSANGNFTTFCVSIDTTFSPGTTYDYDISPTIAVTGGIPPGLPTISLGTAYIYSQFLQGNPDYTAVGNGGVQATIWYLQGILGGADGMVDSETGDLSSIITPVLTDVENATHLSLTALEASSGGAYGVEALNLYDGSGNVYQPQLIETPEPTTMISGAMLLLPFGASTLRILRKNRTA